MGHKRKFTTAALEVGGGVEISIEGEGTEMVGRELLINRGTPRNAEEVSEGRGGGGGRKNRMGIGFSSQLLDEK